MVAGAFMNAEGFMFAVGAINVSGLIVVGKFMSSEESTGVQGVIPLKKFDGAPAHWWP